VFEPRPPGEEGGFAGDLGTAAAAKELVGLHSAVEILVNNLGIFEPKPFEEISDAEWMRFFEVNVLSGLCLPVTKRANWGRIIFISSESALQIPVEMIHYGVTKTAQIALASIACCPARPLHRPGGPSRSSSSAPPKA
jgi:NAD(P)-dependent dehydrogenase (short-subunit alcohol dehydrogenase family)